MDTTITASSNQPAQSQSFSYRTDIKPAAKREYRRRSLGNLFRMGHCAPTVMKSVLDATHTEQEWLVKLTAGMPGGIGNTGFECGGVTSSLVLMGLRYGLDSEVDGLPQIFYRGCGLCQRFTSCNKTLMCREIRGKDRLPLKCIPVVMRSPEILAETTTQDIAGTIPEDKRAAYRRLYAHLTEKRFHCAHAVFQHLGDVPLSQELLNATAGFLGGTAFQGWTCSAFTAGVMAVGLKSGEFENSLPRVLRMIALMGLGKKEAFDDRFNNFNKTMNAGYRMSKWFRQEFGSTQCREITHCDFSAADGVSQYIESDCVTRCETIAEKVSEKVREVLRDIEKRNG
jgi:C_GCAxxG_C_C family probable redox protein